MARPLVLLLLAALLMAGCFQKSPDSATASGHPPTSTMPEAGNQTATPTASVAAAAPFPHEYALQHCLNPRMLFFIDPAMAQANLPPGYHAADATGLMRYIGFPQPPAVTTGRAVAGYDLLSCKDSSLDGGPQVFSEVGVFIDPPTFGGKPLANATNLDLYVLAIHTPSQAWRDLLAAGGFRATESLPATIASTGSGTGAIQGQGSVTAGAPLADAAWSAADHGSDLLVHARYWHSSDAGTFYMDFQLHESVYGGAVVSCTHAAGSAYELVSGTTSCAGEPRFAAVGLDSSIAGGMHLMPGIHPS